jgi:hypothetical protein
MARQLFKKSILKAGQTYHSPDRKVPVTPDRLKHWSDEFQRVKAAGYIVPIDWDHAANIADATPLSVADHKKQRSAKNTVGKMADFKLSPDGQSAEILLEITDPVAQGRAERNEVYISPVIFDAWKDGAENVYRDVITHVDIVNHPVDHSQGPFVAAEPGTVALGIRMGLSSVCRLSSDKFPGDDDEEDDGKQGKADSDPASSDDPSNTLPNDGNGLGDQGKTDADKNPDMPKAQGDDKIAEAIRAHLDQLGAALPADWSFESDAADTILLTALKTLVKANQKADAEKAAGDENDTDDPFGDSDMGKIADPGYAAMSLQARNALAYAEREHRKGIQARIEKLRDEGRCTVDECNKHLEGVGTIRLSLDSDGSPELSDVEKWIDSRQAVPAGTFWSNEQKTRMSTTVAEPAARMSLDHDDNAVQYGLELMGLAKK